MAYGTAAFGVVIMTVLTVEIIVKTAFVLMVLMASLVGCSQSNPVTRVYHQPWEQQFGYTQVVKHGDVLHLSGVTASGDTMAAQIDNIYNKIKSILQTEGLDLSDVIKETLFTTDMAALKRNVATRKTHFKDGEYPASSWIEVKGLFMPEMKLEVEMVVALKK